MEKHHIMLLLISRYKILLNHKTKSKYIMRENSQKNEKLL